jgi:hypothetical protein
VLKISKLEKQHVQIGFGIYCKHLTKNYIRKDFFFVLIPRATLLREITDPFRQKKNIKINDLGGYVLY